MAGTVYDVLAESVQVFTTLDKDFERMHRDEQAIIVAAVDSGRLVDNSDVDEDYWPGVEVDKFVSGWENLDHYYDYFTQFSRHDSN